MLRWGRRLGVCRSCRWLLLLSAQQSTNTKTHQKGQLRQLLRPLSDVFVHILHAGIINTPSHTPVGVVHSHPIQFVIVDVFIV